MRKGYLLTALAALLLLAASSGTASAQVSIGFTTSGGTVSEGADNSISTPGDAALAVTISATGLKPIGPQVDAATRIAPLGTVAIADVGELSFTTSAGTDLTISNLASQFNTNDAFTFYVHQETPDTDWLDEEYSLKLTATGIADGPVSVPRDVFMVKVDDDQVAPVIKFTKSTISLTEDSETSVGIEIEPGSMTAMEQGTLSGDLTVKLAVSNATAVGACTTTQGTASGKDVEILEEGNTTPLAPDRMGMITLAEDAGLTGMMAEISTLTIKACADKDGFKDTDVTLSFVDSSLMLAGAGALANGGSLHIMVQSDEETPVVEFFPTDVFIDEGGSHDVLLSAAGDQNAEVMMATLRVEHDETNVGLYYRDGDKIEPNDDGTLSVKIMGGQVYLTAKSYEDRDLEDGEMAKVTWIIDSADGAEIGDGYWYTVNVRGSTAVPAIPLIGQLLLALFLMAGGSRLYRRRQE